MNKFAKVSEVEVGTKLVVADAGFSCLDEGKVYTVFRDDEHEHDLYITCSGGKHYIDGQVKGDEYIGLIIYIEKTIFRYYYEVRGGHVHISLFGGERGTTLGKCGGIVMRVNEFEDYRKMIEGVNIEFVNRGA